MYKTIVTFSVFITVVYGHFVTHKVDELLESNDLFPGFTLNHTRGHAKKTVKSFITKLENTNAINKAYKKYKINFQKTTPHSKDKVRQKEFKKSIQRVLIHNLHRLEGKESYGKAINNFSDMCFQEFAQKFTGAKFPIHQSTRKYGSITPEMPKSRTKRSPDSFDWRDQNMITPVKKQGQCGCSVVFTSTALVESIYAINNAGQFVSLSEQQLLDCSPNSGGCNGNNTFDDVLSYINETGLASENDYEYRGAFSGSCQQFTTIARIFSVTNITPGARSIQETIASVSPVAVQFRVNQDFKDYDGKSIFNSQDPNCSQANQQGHSVLAVGYGYDNDGGQPYWIMKNSWGTCYGEDGYFKFARGTDICSVEDYPWIISGAGPSSPNTTTVAPQTTTPAKFTTTTSSAPMTTSRSAPVSTSSAPMTSSSAPETSDTTVGSTVTSSMTTPSSGPSSSTSDTGTTSSNSGETSTCEK